MLTRDVTITNKLGLHARAAAKLVSTAGRFAADVFLEKEDRRINGKSIMGVMMLAASQGTVLTLVVDGEDAEAAMDALTSLVDDKFGEGE
ncbi:MAG: HPr family phosphocarrier protein [Chromatiaceae bacterium]